ncbi:MAG TPA: FixH family protein [Bacteroidia bacterium]|nr:FixH family protein [Bacteroidia bacterium]
MKMNWGWGILLVLILFVFFIGNLVYKSSKVNVDLVSENYYEKEVMYQQQINKEKNSLGLEKDVQLSINRNFIEIHFPETFSPEEISGNIQLFKPDDSDLDLSLEVRADSNGKQIINTSALKTGRWEVKINWSYRNTDYYKSEKIMI